ncbi:MAG TPA: hypothetical protein VKA46_00200 [Gemmataceae bacterium]|nr:hypothetical protein [Gemmataceae bacterium]
MIEDTRAAVTALQAELRALDGRLAEADGDADPLAVAEALVGLTKMKTKVAKLAEAVAPPPASPDPGPRFPGFDPESDQEGSAPNAGQPPPRRRRK